MSESGIIYPIQGNEDGGGSGTGALQFINPSNVDHGLFWLPETEYGSCYWEAWVKPTTPNLVGYFISDGSGGAHNVLLGCITSADSATFTGNFFDGSGLVNMDGIDTFPLNQWVHLAWSYDGSRIYLLINGICTYTAAYSGVRQTHNGSSNGHLYAGGSFHDNFPGLVKSIRGIEGFHAGITYTNTFIARDLNGYIPSTFSPGSVSRASFVCDYSVNGTRLFIDGGEGFDGTVQDSKFLHHGVFSRYDNTTDYPVWVEGELTLPDFVPTPPVTPVGAKVFDSFSRVNSLTIIDETASLGSTESGTLGPLTWVGNGSGVLYGRAITNIAQGGTARVLINSTNADVRVTRPNSPIVNTGILGRYKDANNFYKIYASNTSIDFEFMQAGVQTFPPSFTVSGGWTELKVVFSGTTMTVYTDGVSAGSKTVLNDAAALSFGITGNNYINRYDNFTIY